MKIKPKPHPLHTLNSSTQEHMDHLYQGPKSELQHTRKTLGISSWVFKEVDYSIVIGCGSPCSGSVSSLLKTDAAFRPTATGTSCPEVKRLQVKTAIGDELLHQCEQYKATQRVKVEHQCVK